MSLWRKTIGPYGVAGLMAGAALGGFLFTPPTNPSGTPTAGRDTPNALVALFSRVGAAPLFDGHGPADLPTPALSAPDEPSTGRGGAGKIVLSEIVANPHSLTNPVDGPSPQEKYLQARKDFAFLTSYAGSPREILDQVALTQFGVDYGRRLRQISDEAQLHNLRTLANLGPLMSVISEGGRLDPTQLATFCSGLQQMSDSDRLRQRVDDLRAPDARRDDEHRISGTAAQHVVQIGDLHTALAQAGQPCPT